MLNPPAFVCQIRLQLAGLLLSGVDRDSKPGARPPVGLELLVQLHRVFGSGPNMPVEHSKSEGVSPPGVLQVAAPIFELGAPVCERLVVAQGTRELEHGRTGAARRATSRLRVELLPHVEVRGYAGWGHSPAVSPLYISVVCAPHDSATKLTPDSKDSR
jgi:hypothetical protein